MSTVLQEPADLYAGLPRWMTTREVVIYSRFSERQIRQFVHDGAIPHARIGGRLRFDRLALDEWLSGAA